MPSRQPFSQQNYWSFPRRAGERAHVDATASSADCSKVTAKYVGFGDGDKPVRRRRSPSTGPSSTRRAATPGAAPTTPRDQYPSALKPGNHTVVFTGDVVHPGQQQRHLYEAGLVREPVQVDAAASSADCAKVGVRYESFGDRTSRSREDRGRRDGQSHNKSGYTWSGANKHARRSATRTRRRPGTSHGDAFSRDLVDAGLNTRASRYGSTAPAPAHTAGQLRLRRQDGRRRPPGRGLPRRDRHRTRSRRPLGSGSCLSEAKLVFYTRHSRILAQRLYVTERWSPPATRTRTARSQVALPSAGDHYKLRIVARLPERSQRPQVPLGQDGQGEALWRRRRAEAAHRPVGTSPPLASSEARILSLTAASWS